MDVIGWAETNLVFEPDYNVLGRRLFPWPGVESPGWEGAWVVLPAGEVSTAHSHDEAEVFFVVSGTGRLTIDAETRTVSAGDTVFIAPGSSHELVNDGPERVVYISIWWMPGPGTAAAGAVDAAVA
jgi:mannose-6-phosphate isomerase-like protein (cupin superfamily)